MPVPGVVVVVDGVGVPDGDGFDVPVGFGFDVSVGFGVPDGFGESVGFGPVVADGPGVGPGVGPEVGPGPEVGSGIIPLDVESGRSGRSISSGSGILSLQAASAIAIIATGNKAIKNFFLVFFIRLLLIK